MAVWFDHVLKPRSSSINNACLGGFSTEALRVGSILMFNFPPVISCSACLGKRNPNLQNYDILVKPVHPEDLLVVVSPFMGLTTSMASGFGPDVVHVTSVREIKDGILTPPIHKVFNAKVPKKLYVRCNQCKDPSRITDILDTKSQEKFYSLPGWKSHGCQGSLVNDKAYSPGMNFNSYEALNQSLNNAQITKVLLPIVSFVQKKLHVEWVFGFGLKILKEIKVNEEVFAGYGVEYWKDFNKKQNCMNNPNGPDSPQDPFGRFFMPLPKPVTNNSFYPQNIESGTLNTIEEKSSSDSEYDSESDEVLSRKLKPKKRNFSQTNLLNSINQL